MRLAAGLALGLLAACGGGGGGGLDLLQDCGDDAQKRFVLEQMRQWYLFEETLPATVDLDDFADAEALLDFLTATARDQGRDRDFSYLTTLTEDSQYFGEGRYVGFGFVLDADAQSRLFVSWVFVDSPAARAGLARGDEITALDRGQGFEPVAPLVEADTLGDALGDDEIGVVRAFRVVRNGATSEVTVAKGIVTIDPVAPAGGVRLIPRTGMTPVGYVHLLSFISPAEPALRAAFAQFRVQNVTDVIVDLRYNGGGLSSISELLGNLLGAQRAPTDVFDRVEFNSRNTERNSTGFFAPQPESIAPQRIAFITSGGSASASESIVNAMKPYADVAIIGEDSFGKPVGQVGLVMEGCDVLLRPIAFRIENSLGEGDYYTGLAETLPGAACAAGDDLSRLPGDVDEASTREALQWLASGVCTSAIAAGKAGARTLPLELRSRPAGGY